VFCFLEFMLRLIYNHSQLLLLINKDGRGSVKFVACVFKQLQECLMVLLPLVAFVVDLCLDLADHLLEHF
jgi:hypothetical protein